MHSENAGAPSHVVLFDDLLANPQVERELRRHGYVELSRMLHKLELVGWDGWAPQLKRTHPVVMRSVRIGKAGSWRWLGRVTEAMHGPISHTYSPILG
jgi:hypothetical protein